MSGLNLAGGLCLLQLFFLHGLSLVTTRKHRETITIMKIYLSQIMMKVVVPNCNNIKMEITRSSYSQKI